MKAIIRLIKKHTFQAVLLWLAFIIFNILFMEEIARVIGILMCLYFPSLLVILAVLLYKWDCWTVDTYDNTID